MNENLEAFKVWAPAQALWSAWAKPVLFMGKYPHKNQQLPQISPPDWIASASRDTVAIVDLAGQESLMEGLRLAQIGFRPVPLYNGVSGPSDANSLVAVHDIVDALFMAVPMLAQMNLPTNAPPAFLLDSRRMTGSRSPRKFDNRWCVFPQDMPSAEFLIRNGIQKVIVRTLRMQDDLLHILYRYQKANLRIYIADAQTVKEQTIHKPSRFREFGYRMKIAMKLGRNAAGGFGSAVPEPQSSSGGHYRYG